MSLEMQLVNVLEMIRRQKHAMISHVLTGLHGQSGPSARPRVEEETRREAETVWLSGMVDPTVTVRVRVSRTWNVTLMDVQTSPHGQSGVHVPRHVVEE